MPWCVCCLLIQIQSCVPRFGIFIFFVRGRFARTHNLCWLVVDWIDWNLLIREGLRNKFRDVNVFDACTTPRTCTVQYVYFSVQVYRRTFLAYSHFSSSSNTIDIYLFIKPWSIFNPSAFFKWQLAPTKEWITIAQIVSPPAFQQQQVIAPPPPTFSSTPLLDLKTEFLILTFI